MFQILEKFYSNLIVKENFQDETTNSRSVGLLSVLLAIVTILILQLVLGKYLWNNYLVNAVTIVKPLESIVDLIAISFLLKLLFN